MIWFDCSGAENMQTFTKPFCIEHVHGSTQWNLCLFMHLLTLTNIPSPSGWAATAESAPTMGFLTGSSIHTGIRLTHIHHWCIRVKKVKHIKVTMACCQEVHLQKMKKRKFITSSNRNTGKIIIAKSSHGQFSQKN